MKKIKYILLLITMLLIGKPVYADHIYNVAMDIYLDEQGNAKIEEVWDVKADDGSEWYKQLYNMGNEKLENFSVLMDGKELTYKTWNINESMREKAGYFGINNVSEGIELCFGKYDLQRHKFTLKYTLTNFIFNTSDSQVLYQTLLPNATVDNFQVNVQSFYEFPDTLDVWGYGYKGYAYVSDGFIEMSNEESTSLNGDYVVLLAKFPVDTFKTVNSYPDYSKFDDVLDLAEEGSYEYDYDLDDDSSTGIFAGILSFLASFLVPIIIIIFAAKNGTEYGTKKIKFRNGKKLKDVQYFREIPFGKDLHKPYWIACQYGLVKNKTDFLGAILLRWLKDGNVENTTVKRGMFNKEERAIKFVNSGMLTGLEKELYDMMLLASVDGTLESNEFSKWCKKNYSKILKWFNRVIDDTTMKYVSEGYITEEKKTFGKHYYVESALEEDAKKVAGIKKFLNDFSQIKERETIEVQLWEEYLMYAQIFGIAKKVAKELKNLYPEVITDDAYEDVLFMHNIAYTGVSAASSARAAAQSYSSGGGGFSSGGGGGGSFGGGGSMGGR